MELLFVHRSYPGQFRWILPELVKKGIKIKFICIEKTDWPHQGIEVVEAKSSGADSLEKIGYDFADASLQAAIYLKKKGFEPHAIISHYGYGLWRCKNVFKDSKLIVYCEWLFNADNRKFHGWEGSSELSFDQEIINKLQQESLETAIALSDAAICPTEWQKNSFPKYLRNKICVLEDGFPTSLFYPKRVSEENSDDEYKLSILYISRGIEYTRGIDRLCEIIDKSNKECGFSRLQFTIIADKRRVYDEKDAWNKNLPPLYEKLTKIPNVNVVGQLPYNQYIDKIQASDIHLYLSRPFVLSWSFIESSLLGSFLLSFDNPSTIEVSHSNHKDMDSADSIVNVIKNFSSSKSKISLLRSRKHDWTNTEEYNIYKYRFCLSRQINQLLAMIIKS